MIEVRNDLELINKEVKNLFIGSNFWKFSYSGIYTFEFSLNKKIYGYDFFKIDFATNILVQKKHELAGQNKSFSIEDILNIWSYDVTQVSIDKYLVLSIFFENDYCCKIDSQFEDTMSIEDMCWEIYQNRNETSFKLLASAENEICLQIP